MMRLAHAVMALLFFFGAAVQWNDPDPARWMAIYLGAGVACLLAALRRGHWVLPAAVGLAALVWAATLAPSVLGKVEPTELVGDWEMKDARVEIGREMYGLLIIAAWMGVTVVTERGRRARSRSDYRATRAPRRARRG
jgi:Transmembrane family 220, helix